MTDPTQDNDEDSDDDEIECHICYQSIPQDDTAHVLPCRHDKFCGPCMLAWSHSCVGPCRCPVCNMPVTAIHTQNKLVHFGNVSVTEAILWWYGQLLNRDGFEAFAWQAFKTGMLLLWFFCAAWTGVKKWDEAVVETCDLPHYATTQYPVMTILATIFQFIYLHARCAPLVYDAHHDRRDFLYVRVIWRFILIYTPLVFTEMTAIQWLCPEYDGYSHKR